MGKMTNEKIQQLNIREYQLGLKLLELANNVVGGEVGDYGPIAEAIKAVQQSLANEQKNGLAQLNELGDDPEDFEDESVYANDIAWLNKIEQSIGNLSNRPGAKVPVHMGKQSLPPDQADDLRKEFGKEETSDEPAETSDWGGGQADDLKRLFGAFKEGPDNRFPED